MFKARLTGLIAASFVFLFLHSGLQAFTSGDLASPSVPSAAPSVFSKLTVPDIAGVLVSAGRTHTCARLADRTVRCWGDNRYGQLGDGTNTSSSAPVQVKGLNNVAAISAGALYTCALEANGTVWCWGYNGKGNLGNGSDASSNVPVKVTGSGPEAPSLLSKISSWRSVLSSPRQDNRLGTAVAVSAGTSIQLPHTCALKNDSTVWCWGSNEYHELSRSEGSTVKTPQPILSNETALPLKGIQKVFSGDLWMLGVDGRVFGWGTSQYMIDLSEKDPKFFNENVATGCSGPIPYPQRIDYFSGEPALTNAVLAESGSNHGCVLLADGAVLCLGSNGLGQLGSSDEIGGSSYLIRVKDLTDVTGISAGGNHTCALVSHRKSVETPSEPSPTEAPFPSELPSYQMPSQVDNTAPSSNASAFSSLGAALGAVWCWGSNEWGQLGSGEVSSGTYNAGAHDPVPVEVQGLGGVAGVSAGASHTCAVKGGSSIWCWGSNSDGQLGGNVHLSSAVPIQVTFPVPAIKDSDSIWKPW